MPKRDTLRRIIEIDRQIRAGSYPHPDALATELEVSRRVIFNDRAYLVNVLRAPLEFHSQRRGWYYTEPNYALPSTMVTRGELLAFLLAVEAAQRQLGPALESELHAAIEKIGHSLQGSVEVNWESLRRHFTITAPIAADAAEHTLLALHEAIERQCAVQMRYLTASRGERSQRQVEPHHLQNVDGEWYLIAFDRARGKLLTFNTARIDELKILPRTFTRQADFSPHDWQQTGFRIESNEQVFEVSIRFDAAQAIYIRERHWHGTQRLEEQADGGLILHFQASGLGEITRWVLQYGSHAQVIGPLALRERVQHEVQAMMQIYREKPNE
ncbi:MAG TPA: WYL domain-containing protein [Abditibacteriaceae bacterium]|jgi:predicted DNA-binding transcriptional regulator YafY